MRPQIAEIDQHPVAHELGDKAVVARDDAGNGVLIGADLLAQFLEFLESIKKGIEGRFPTSFVL